MTTTKPQPTTEALEPCPFNGEKVRMVRQYAPANLYIQCACGISMDLEVITVNGEPEWAKAEQRLRARWNTRLSPASTAPPNHALIQLLDAALLHPESAEGNIRQVIESLASTAPVVGHVSHWQLRAGAEETMCGENAHSVCVTLLKDYASCEKCKIAAFAYRMGRADESAAAATARTKRRIF